MEGITWSEIFELFGYAILATLIAGVVCPLVGSFLLVRRTGFYGITLPQFAAAGIACGFALVGWWAEHVGIGGIDQATIVSGSHAALNYHLFWASLFTLGGLFAMVLVGRKRGTETGRIAAAFAIASALTILFAMHSPVGDIYVHELLRGEILAVGFHELDTLAVLYGAVTLTVVIFHRDLVLVSYDRDTARVLGKRVWRWELLLLNLVGVTVATGVMIVGPVVLFGLLVIPPLAARGLARSFLSFLILSSTLGLVSAVIGLWISFRLDWPLGPSVVCAATLCLVPNWLLGRRR